MAVNKARLAANLVGVGAGGELEKLTISFWDGTYLGPKRRIREVQALFNPAEIGISREVAYEPRRVARPDGLADFRQEYRSVRPATLAIDLFFDTYESRSAPTLARRAVALATPANPFLSGDATDVTDRTSEVAALALPLRPRHRPPLCHLRWGSFDIFTGVLTSVDERYTLFLNDGTPVRATVSCRFVESTTTAQARTREMHSADVAKTRIVRRNDTLHGIAAEEYDDPALWRVIARANGIVNPRRLPPGTALLIPKLRP